jgi:menaquinone-dependent protoporphyrinogen IX oxidase
MKTLLAYFSGTGNSLFLAKELSGNIPDSTLLSVTKALRENMACAGFERIVIVYPVYYVGLPAIVQRFVARFDFSPFTAIYSVCTSGDDDGELYQDVRRDVAGRDRRAYREGAR